MKIYLQYILNCIQDDQEYFAVFGSQQVKQRLQDIALDQVGRLLHRPTAGIVGDCPHCLLLSLVVSLNRNNMIFKAREKHRH